MYSNLSIILNLCFPAGKDKDSRAAEAQAWEWGGILKSVMDFPFILPQS